MPADQAAGLRRRRARHAPRCIHCFFDTAESTTRLMHALYVRGWTVLLIDARGRMLADSPTRSLFDWKQQLERGQLRALPMPYGDGWHAPGARADAPALATIAQDYDCLVFDASLDAPDWAALPAAVQILAIEVSNVHESVLHAYALLKTLSHAGVACSVGLLGDAAACRQLQAACRKFLDPAFARAVCSVADEKDAFGALAARMTTEETGLTARYKKGST